MIQNPIPSCLRACALALTCSTLTFAQTQPNSSIQPTIQVSGDAEIRVAPDLVDLCIGVEIKGKELLSTQEEQNKRVVAVIASLKKAGIEDRDIQTGHVTINPVFNDDSDKITPLGFEVKRSIHCTLRNPGKFDELLTASLQAGATDVSQFNYRSSELRKYKDAARIAALKAAREKATLLAKELGMSVGRAQSVIENLPNGTVAMRESYFGTTRNSIDSISAGSVSGGLATGQVGVSATIYVTFALE